MGTLTTPPSLSDDGSRIVLQPDAVCELDATGRIVAANTALADLVGRPVTDLVGSALPTLWHADDAERVRAELQRTLAGQVSSFRAGGGRAGGWALEVTATTLPIVIGAQVVGAHVVLRDIGPELDARDATRRSEARLQQVFDSAGAGLAMLTRGGRILRTNPAFPGMLGFDQDDLTTRDLWDLVHPDDVDRLHTGLGLLLDEGRPSVAVQVRCRHGAGHVVWLRASLTTIEWSDAPVVLLTAEDVTSLYATDARLEQSQSLVRMAGRIARTGGWRIDLTDGTTQLSTEMHRVLGNTTDEPMDLHAVLASYPPEHRTHVQAALDACARDGIPFDLEATTHPRPGRQLWLRLIGEPERDQAGRIVAIRGVAQDIGDRRQAEQETQELAQRLTATFESITDAVMTLDATWRFTYCNRRAAELLQRDRFRLLGRVIWEELPHLQETEAEHTVRRVAATGQTEVIDAFHDDNLQGWFEVNIYPSPEGGVTIYFRDVSERHRARVQLRQQARLLDQARDAIVVRDLRGRITYWNHSAERLYGWSAQEALGQDERDLVAGDIVGFEEALAHTRANGAWTGELTQVDRLGRELVVEARWTLVHDEVDDNWAILTISTDVTERRQLEAQFLQAQRMESLGTLASGIAHDLNNALSPVLMAGQLLADDETDPQRRELIDVIADSARRGADMVQQVLSFARGVEGKRITVDVGAIVRDLDRLARETFPKRVTVRTNVAPDLWWVTGDPTQLHQVLLNLCVNARDAMPRGGTLSISLANLVVEGRRRAHRPDLAPGPYVRITVSDTGHGMTREVLDHIFEPFYTTKSAESGSGLGLSTSLGIVESHGGSLEAHSRPGLGSIFTIDLPATPAVGTADPDPDRTTTRGHGEVVLLVDDEPAVRRLASQILERAGYRVVTAVDGHDALQAAGRLREDLALLVTDMMMPRMDGATAIGLIRDLRPGLPVVAISGLRAELDRELTGVGSVHLLRKPFTTPELLDVVAAALAPDAGPTLDPGPRAGDER